MPSALSTATRKLSGFESSTELNAAADHKGPDVNTSARVKILKRFRIINSKRDGLVSVNSQAASADDRQYPGDLDVVSKFEAKFDTSF